MYLLTVVAVSSIVSLCVFGFFIHGFSRGWFVFQSDKRLQEALHQDYVNMGYVLDEVKSERNDLMEELIEANRKIKKLENSETMLKQRIEELEKELGQYKKVESLPTTPLLLICGDEGFCKDDAAQLNRARVWYRMIEHATKRDINDEIARRRQNGDLYTWVQVSAHGNHEGILLSDGIAEPNWWQTSLEGVSVLFAANCESAKVGDALAGVVDYVIVFYGERDTEEIARYTYAFWSEMMKSDNARSAYRKALIEVPSLRPFTDLRTR